MNEIERTKLDDVAAWRSIAGDDNPAGPLFADYAEAEIVLATVGGSGRCGTACSGSRTRQCC